MTTVVMADKGERDLVAGELFSDAFKLDLSRRDLGGSEGGGPAW